MSSKEREAKIARLEASLSRMLKAKGGGEDPSERPTYGTYKYYCLYCHKAMSFGEVRDLYWQGCPSCGKKPPNGEVGEFNPEGG